MEGGKEGNIPPTDDTDGHGNFSLPKLNKIVEKLFFWGNKNTPSLMAIKIYKNQVEFLLCS